MLITILGCIRAQWGINEIAYGKSIYCSRRYQPVLFFNSPNHRCCSGIGLQDIRPGSLPYLLKYLPKSHLLNEFCPDHHNENCKLLFYSPTFPFSTALSTSKVSGNLFMFMFIVNCLSPLAGFCWRHRFVLLMGPKHLEVVPVSRWLGVPTK